MASMDLFKLQKILVHFAELIRDSNQGIGNNSVHYLHKLIESDLISEKFRVELKQANLKMLELEKDRELRATEAKRVRLTEELAHLDENLEQTLIHLEDMFRKAEFDISDS